MCLTSGAALTARGGTDVAAAGTCGNGRATSDGELRGSSFEAILRDARLRRALRMRSWPAAKYQILMVRSPPKRASRTMQAESLTIA
ncbi:hypothetical protein XH99_17675 [Bradyrhizobium nanningense]|uniref:Uncharacterized protein n=1 Tax=Bradyrhizobium nanningense TaxID=1325118 RepID=A0A4Q0S696_9BRAD|nr:hypothetical protein XH84_35055 [Bradyrhizobium nanningense]RXH26952.1 hypothetical protein XH99_17675 [Bradyrhizobium nanningense]